MTNGLTATVRVSNTMLINTTCWVLKGVSVTILGKKIFTKTLLEFIKYCNILYQKLDFYLRFIHWQIPDMIYADTIVKSSTALTYFGGI